MPGRVAHITNCRTKEGTPICIGLAPGLSLEGAACPIQQLKEVIDKEPGIISPKRMQYLVRQVGNIGKIGGNSSTYDLGVKCGVPEDTLFDQSGIDPTEYIRGNLVYSNKAI